MYLLTHRRLGRLYHYGRKPIIHQQFYEQRSTSAFGLCLGLYPAGYSFVVSAGAKSFPYTNKTGSYMKNLKLTDPDILRDY
ncbi:predicted protein [Sclerotinia sclerotiorum 1980 UF-70]|uniref:Uncharacterized protein n=1 Tax=Sclerotinia sclerotiorum (strain ATCC 18683 / 1980 / Ss-1) TaxID=665079 RepID=A7FA57_SCLS1|nr:predicted protein [Sclerotinia sclerotiorum 1980 UF-70]EDO00618.1 predicted protein [Sclerotinia sclerotiorum 1980 UF-70]